MTDNQFNQLFDLVTKSVNGIQRIEKDIAVLKEDMSEVKADIAELKTGQNRIEKQIRLNNAAINEIAGEQVRIRSIVSELEKATV